MPVDYYSLTDSQQKKLSEIRKKIKYQEGIITKAIEIANQSPTYEYNRAVNSVEYHTKQLEEVDITLARRIEKLKEESKRTKEMMERNLVEAQQRLEKEKKKQPKDVIKANHEIKILNQELASLGLPQIEEPALTQPVEVSKPIKQSKDKELAVSFQEFMASGFDEEEELARSRRARGLIVDVPPPPQEIEETPQEEQPSYNQTRFVQQSYSDRPPTITNTKAKKPVKQVPGFPKHSITSI